MPSTNVFGLHAVHSLLLNNAASVTRLYVSEARSDKRLAEIQALAEEKHIQLQRVAKKALHELVGEVKHQGVVAVCSLREPLSEPQLLKMVMSLEKAFLLVVDGVTDPHNLGAILRSADAAGVDAVIVPKDGSAGLTPAVRKVACGAAETMAFCPVTNLKRTLAELKSMGIWFYGAADTATSNYTSVDYSGAVGLVVGAEGKGLRRLTKEACDDLISIPMAGTVSSLNVSVATGICLFEVVRQRQL